MVPVDNSRIAKNTMMLYARMLLMLVVNVYASRNILEFLGVQNYGIYDVVAGFVSMFAIISGAMTTATNRYLSVELGKQDEGNVGNVFSTAVIIHLMLGAVVIVLAETFGLYFLNSHLEIPSGKMLMANWVFQISLVTFVVNLVSVPYNAAIVSYEKMHAFAYVSIAEALLKLAAVFGLLLFDAGKRLVVYAILIALIAIIVRGMYWGYCNRYLRACRFVWCFDKVKIKSMFSFVGWNLIGSVAGVLKDQGLNVLLNMFFGVLINAAQGIARQVYNAVSGFVSNFQMAMNPQIIKSYSANERGAMFRLVFGGSRLSFFLMMTMSMPIIIETPFILNIWLKEPPEFTAIFLRLMLLTALVDSLSGPLITTMHASGNVKLFQIVVGGIQLLTLPLAYLLLKAGFEHYWVYVLTLIIAVISLFTRLLLLKGIVAFPVREYLSSTLCRVAGVFVLSNILPLCLYACVPYGWLSLIAVTLASVISSLFFVFVVGLLRDEQNYVTSKLVGVLKRR